MAGSGGRSVTCADHRSKDFRGYTSGKEATESRREVPFSTLRGPASLLRIFGPGAFFTWRKTTLREVDRNLSTKENNYLHLKGNIRGGGGERRLSFR